MVCSTSVTPSIGFVDLATYDEICAFHYGGATAVTYFVRSVKKANWFTFVPISLRHCGGVPNFGEEFSASVNRSGDYVLNVWLRVLVPQLKFTSTAGGVRMRWTHNFMHNLVRKVTITFNELVVHEFDSAWFDYNHYLRCPASKRVGYETMIGEIPSMNVFTSGPLGTGGYFNLPIPFFFTEDSGIALPVAALPFNDVKINYCLRDWKDLIVLDAGTSGLSRDALLALIVDSTTLQAPKLGEVYTNAHYAVIHNDERVLMGKAPRDMSIIQVQALQEQPFDALQSQQSYDLRFSHAVRLIVWGARNQTVIGEWSNYAVLLSAAQLTGGVTDPVDLNNFDPMAQSTLIYENTPRVDSGADYYSTVVPWYWCDAIPDVSGIHAYSYSLEAFGLDPKGSTSYSKLANVSMCIEPSTSANVDADPSALPIAGNDQYASFTGHKFFLEAKRKYRTLLRVANTNIIRQSGGSLGLPVL